ncbi:MAG: glycosyltransferase family 87 protein [Pseudomonadota bacterium]
MSAPATGRRGPSTARPAARAVYALAAGIVGALLIARAAPDLRRSMRQTPWDLNVDHLTARAYLDGYSPYTAAGAKRSGVDIAGLSGHGHPPTTAFWILPLAPLSIHTAGRLLAWITFVLLFVELTVAMHLLAVPAPIASAWLATSFVVGCSFMSYHVGVGQISGLIGFLYFVGWWAARAGKDVAAGAALGAACTLKLFPGVMVLFLLVSRRFKAAAAAGAVYLAVAAVMTARFGLGSWRRFFTVQPAIADQWMGSIQNQSVHGIVTRFFEPVCQHHGPVVPAAMRISAAVSVVLFVLATRWTWGARHRSDRSPAAFDAAFALFATLSVITSQWVWEHYAVIYVLPLVILAARLRAEWCGGRARAKIAAVATVVVGVGASWLVEVQVKQDLQRAVWAGDRALHARLHLVDTLAWLPALALAGALFIVCRWRTDAQTAPPREWSPVSPP